MKGKSIFSKVLFLIFIFILMKSQMSSKKQLPNVVLIFMDDMGYGDLSCYGAVDYMTPNIDKLAAEGMRFTNFLSAQAVCTASRAGLLTGCYPNRIGLHGALMPNSKVGINSSEVTLAEMLKEKGYATGIFGKWHLGHHKEFLPLQHGFDEYYGLPYSNDMWPVDYDGISAPQDSFRKSTFSPLYFINGNEKDKPIKNLKDQASIIEILTSKAIDFISRNKKKPFFLYLPNPMPHVPIAASTKFIGKSKQGLYGDVMMEIDWSVGEIMKSLKEYKLDKNTIVILTSDNGPWLTYGNHAGSTGGLREGKTGTFEGGHRVPCIIKWEGQLPKGEVCNQLCSTIDLLPTIAKLTHAKLPNHKIDGVDITSLLKGGSTNSPRKDFYYYYRKNSLQAVRRENWKLVLPHTGKTYEGGEVGNNGYPGKSNDNNLFPLALYDLRRDPGERYDVKATYPDKVKELLLLAEEARTDLGDENENRKGNNVRKSGEVKQ
jgi:arylsulfatase A-like enzyme